MNGSGSGRPKNMMTDPAMIRISNTGYGNAIMFCNTAGKTFFDNQFSVLGGFLMYFIQQYFICRPSESTVTKEAGIEPRTFSSQSDILTTWLDLIHTRKIFARIKMWKRRIQVADDQ
jgi:hypothetical protein